jgi:hypothetical protein
MNRTAVLAVAAALVLAGAARASDPTGIYAVIDRVVLEPSQDPELAQVWGVFVFTKDRGRSYTAPQRGYMYFKLTPGKADVCRIEWKDLAKLSGTGQAVAFGSSYRPGGTLRKTGTAPKDPEVYPLGVGLSKLEADHPLTQKLRSLPEPVAPTDGAEVPPGAVTLRVQNLEKMPKARYVFQIADSKGASEKSEPLAPGDRETRWTPSMQVKPGEKYTWQVWIVDGKFEGARADGTFKGKATP